MAAGGVAARGVVGGGCMVGGGQTNIPTNVASYVCL